MTPKIDIAKATPWDQGEPAIHGPSIYGASIGKPFLYTVPVTGERPLRFSAEGLPQGLHLNSTTGHIVGTVRQKGDSKVLLRAENQHGNSEKEFTIAIGRGLALTPPMGWNSWNAWRRWVDDARMRSAAEDLVRTGLAARGYSHVNIDSCWQGQRGGMHGAIQPNRKFPDMKSLADHCHALGLKFGIYSTPWTMPWGCTPKEAEEDWSGPGLIGCSSGNPDPDYHPNSIVEGRFVGLEKHEAQDVAQWVEWGVDFLKYDWNPTDMRSLERMGRLVKEASRDITLSICTNARLEDADAIRTWANMWRGLPDTDDEWSSVVNNAFLLEESQDEDWRPHVGPGSWNDLDMLALGPQSGSEGKCRLNRLSPDGQITTMTAWALYPSPIILSCDLSALSDFEMRLFCNEEVIAVNQDRLGRPSVRLREQLHETTDAGLPNGQRHVWARALADGSTVVGLFNLSDSPHESSFDFRTIALSGSVAIRNLWERRNLGRHTERFSIAVPAHGAQLLKCS